MALSAPTGLADLVAPLAEGEFRKRFWRREPVHLPGSPDRFGALFGWDRLNAVLGWGGAAIKRLNLARNGDLIDRARYTDDREGIAALDAGAVTRLLGEGATLLLDRVDLFDEAVASLADMLSQAFQAKCTINLYAGWRSDPGFVTHWDTHDVFVVQMDGRKEWTVHRPTVPDPVRETPFVAPDEEAAPFWAGTMVAGDVLYLPRGVPHRAVPLDEPSLHLTIGIHADTGVMFLRSLVDQMAQDAFVRADIPSVDDAVAREEWLAGLRRRLEAAASSDGLDAFTATNRADAPARPVFAFPSLVREAPADWTDRTRVRLASRRGVAVSRGAGGSRAAIGTVNLTCSDPVAARLGALVAGQWTAIGELGDGLDEEAKRELRRILVMAQLAGELFSQGRD